MLPIMRFVGVGLVVGVVAIGVACSSSKTDGGATTPATVTQHISAASGGTVADTAGTATLSVPGGALGADLDITLATTAAESGTATSVYNFGPEGTKFATPATLVLKLPTSSPVPSGMTATLATYDGTKWAPIEGSTFANGQVTGPVAHFSKFTIVFVNGEAVVTNSCSDKVTSFHACGGAISGAYTFTDWCFPSSSLGGDPTDGGCPGFSVVADATPSGSITFNGDGTYSNTAITVTGNVTWTIPSSCLGAVKTCDPTSLNIKNGACNVTGANCVCTSAINSQSGNASSSTWSTSGTTITIDGKPYDYCVSGSTVEVLVPDGKGGTQVLYVLTKQ
jgi:hypothetical protein